MKDIMALQVELDAANKKIQECNNTIVSQAKELTILHNIICQSCRRKVRNETFNSSFSSSSPQTASSTSVDQASVPDSFYSTHEVPIPESSSPRNPTTQLSQSRQASLSSTTAAPPIKFGNTETTGGMSSSKTKSRQGNPEDNTVPSSPLPARLRRPTSSRFKPKAASSTSDQASIPDFPAPFHSTHEVIPQSPFPHIYAAKISQSRQVSLSSTTAAPPRLSGNTETTGGISSSNMTPRSDNPENDSQFRWLATHSSKADKILDINLERTFSHEDQVNCVKFSLDSKYVAIGLSGKDSKNILFNGKVIVYCTETGEQLCRLVEHTEKDKSGVRTICFSPNSKVLAIGHFDGHISLWVISGERVRSMLRGNRVGVSDLDFSCNGRSIVSALGDDSIRIWNVRDASSKLLKEENIADWPMYRCARFSPNGRFVAAANKDGFLRIWDSRTQQLVGKWHGHKNVVSSLAFMPDGKGLLSGSLGSAVKYWRISTTGGKETGSTIRDTVTWFEGHTSWVLSIAVAADGRWLLSGSNDRTARLWDISNGTQQCILQGHPDRILSVDISRVGNYLVVGDGKGQVSLWRYIVI